MHASFRSTIFVFVGIFLVAALTATLEAQPDRISARIDSRRTVLLTGQVPSRARPEFDQGAVSRSFAMRGVTIYLKPSPAQQASLEQLLTAQRDPASADFHKWLMPEQYAERFGASRNDVKQISAWLTAQGLTVDRVAQSRTWIEFSGTAQQVGNALDTQIHQYLEKGEVHYANSTDPSIPEALSGMVLSFRGLNNYRLKPRNRRMGPPPQDNAGNGEHHIAPDDFATIYDVARLYTAGLDGTGQKLVVVGQTDIYLSDIQTFRSTFHLPAINLQKILVSGQADPGISDSDLPEADLDVEWSGAVARNAMIFFVYSPDVFTSVQDAVDQDYAPVISMSYGLCEDGNLADLPGERQMAQQANSEGITWLAASGDTGAADCDDLDPSPFIAENGLSVDAPGSVPEVTAMGGTEFNEGGGSYWSNSNTANSASALSYIPEKVWNDTGFGIGLSAGGGGASLYFPQPVWQSGPGVPNNGFRNVPDLSISASPDHDGYIVYTSGSQQIYGGTSFAAPTMAGIVTLLNEYLISSGAQQQAGLGNINPTLYRMAQNSTGAFHDLTIGNNSVPCVIGSPNCTSGVFGYNAGPGYDRASGLGSVDAYNFVHQWTSQAPTASAVVPSLLQMAAGAPYPANPVYEQSGSWPFILTLTEEAGVTTTLTSVTINGVSYNVASVFGKATIPANGSVSSATDFSLTNLAVPANVVFVFHGEDMSGRQWTETLSVPFEGPQTALVVGGASNAASGKQSYAPGMLVSVYGSAFGDFAQSAGVIPLPQYLAGFEASVNGVSTPLYYVSPNQVNIQIPYEAEPGNATLVVGNPYLNANNYNLVIAPAAPGIFMTNGATAAPFSSAARGETTTLFITGEGQVSPALADGTTPAAGTPSANLPKPQLPVTVTVASQNANIAFIGIPSGLVGVTQINYVVPANTPLGVQPVVVTVGGVPSQAANLTVTQ
jgi:uncharacterized protein (TIGR03437 family)